MTELRKQNTEIAYESSSCTRKISSFLYHAEDFAILLSRRNLFSLFYFSRHLKVRKTDFERKQNSKNCFNYLDEIKIDFLN